MAWENLPMRDRATIIRLGVQSGLRDMSSIRETYNKFAEGGEVDKEIITPIKHPVIPKSDDPQAINFLANWLNNRRRQLYNNIIDSEIDNLPYLTKPKDKNRGDIRKDGWDKEYIDIQPDFMQYLLLNNPDRIATNKGFYTEINNAASAPQVILSNNPSSSFDTRGLYMAPNSWNNTGHYIVYAGIPDNGVNIHERTHAMNAAPQERVIETRINNSNYQDKYYDSSKEVYARLMQYRFNNKLSPQFKVTKEYLEKNRDKLKALNLDRYSDNDLLFLFNEVAENSINNNDNKVEVTNNFLV